MTQPPHGSESERPQDRPHDPTRAFPTTPGQNLPAVPQYGQQYSQPGQPGQPGQPQYGQPGQPGQYGQPSQGQYGQAQYGQGQYGQAQYPPQYGQAPGPYAQSGYAGYGYTGSGGTNGLATASLVCALGGLIIGLSAPVAIGLAIAALVQIKKRNQDGKGMAIAGLVIGSLITIGSILAFVFLIILGVTASNTDYGAPTAPQPTSTTTT